MGKYFVVTILFGALFIVVSFWSLLLCIIEDFVKEKMLKKK